MVAYTGKEFIRGWLGSSHIKWIRNLENQFGDRYEEWEIWKQKKWFSCHSRYWVLPYSYCCGCCSDSFWSLSPKILWFICRLSHLDSRWIQIFCVGCLGLGSESTHSFTPLAYEVEDGSLPPSKTLKMENFTILGSMFGC